MKKQILILTALTIFAFNLNATVWRVNNNAGIDADFKSFAIAHNAASNNDTIYLEGSPTSYGNITFIKPLVVIGPGYFLTENPQTQANLNSAKVGSVTFDAGSSGSIISGLVITGTIEIKVGNITIKNNYIKKEIALNSTNSYSNVFICQNYIYNYYVSSSGYTSYTAYGIHNNAGSSNIYNVTISNNLIYAYSKNNNGLSYNHQAYPIKLGTNYSGTISNNVIYSFGSDGNNTSVSNFTFTNNILMEGNLSLNNNTFFNNIGSGTQFPLGNGNQQNVNMADVFVESGSSDGCYQLKSTSPAIGAGNDGTDCGMFGGVTPYVLSGMPSIPAVYEINMPSIGTSNDGINVTVKAKAH